MSRPDERGDPKFLTQFGALQAAFNEDGTEIAIGYDEQGAPAFIYVESHVLARSGRLAEVQQALPGSEPVGEPVGDIVRLSLGGRRIFEMREDIEPLMRADMISYEHVVSVCPVAACPADEPIPVPDHQRFNPAVNADRTLGHGVKVLVIDTGLVADYQTHPEIRTVISDSPEITDSRPNAQIPEYSGHGTFIAGLLMSVAPGIELHVVGGLRKAGGVTEMGLAQIVMAAAERIGWPDIISLSAGTPTPDNRPLLSLEAFFRELRQQPQTLLVAAAGNNGNRVPFWPAALAGPYPEPFPGVVSVGALRRDGLGLACFSDYGPWVNVYAPGEKLVNVFTTGDYIYVDPASERCRFYPPPPPEPHCTCTTAPKRGSPAHFSGMASWSGTSFSTPIVAGMIAAYMSKTREHSRRAASELIASAETMPGVGQVLRPPTWSPTALV